MIFIILSLLEIKFQIILIVYNNFIDWFLEYTPYFISNEPFSQKRHGLLFRSG